MKKFKFSMQKVLEYKTHMEEQEKIRLQQMENEYRTLCGEREDIFQKFEAYQKIYDEKCARGVAVQEVIAIRSYMGELTKQSAWIQKKIERAEMKIERHVQKIIGISSEKSSVGKLREKHYIRYEKERQKEDEALMDEFVVNAKHSGNPNTG